MQHHLLLVGLILILAPVAQTQENMENEAALVDTQTLLRDSQQRNEALKKAGSAGEKADQKVTETLGAENSEEAYQLAAEILPEISKRANGDPAKMQELLLEAQRNPESFSQYLTPKTRAQLKKLAEKAGKPGVPNR